MLPAFSSCKLLRPVLCCLSTIFALSIMLSGTGCGSANSTAAFTQLPISPPPTYSEIYEFGDSITHGKGAIRLSMGYGSLLIADFAGGGTNFAVPGASSADESDVMLKNYNPQQSNNPAVTSMIGTNDLFIYGGNYRVFQADVAGMMEWATVPRNAKVFFTDAQCTSTGAWSNVATYGFPGGVEQSTTPSSTYTCAIVTTGPALYFGFMQDTGWTAGRMTILIDGASPSSGATIHSKNYYGSQETYKFTTVRYPLAAGSHTFTVTYAGTAGATGTIAPVWLGSAYPISNNLPPRIFIADVPVQEANGNGSLIATYNAALMAVIEQLQGDGLPIVHVQENAAASGSGGPLGTGWLNTDVDFVGGTVQGATCAPSDHLPLHPGNCGHAHLRDAFEYYIQPYRNTGSATLNSQPTE
ncbi:MAG: SGNH/GDSL hydrolase family protein [Acidobacteriota bacterium]